jgi:hypothetical protein
MVDLVTPSRHTALEGFLKDGLRISWPEWTIRQGGVACDVDALGWESLLRSRDE